MNQEVFFSNIRNEIIKHLKECNSELKIAVAWFTDKKIINEVNHLIEQGVDVSIIIYDDSVNQKDFFEQLYYNKSKIYLSKKLMHNKFCIIDNKTVINGSYNWTLNANSNDENIQISYNNITLANKFNNEFEKLVLNCKLIDSHFEYSLSNLEIIESEFENYYSNWPNYKFPYFIDLINFKPSKENLNTNVKGYVYLIKNPEEGKIFLWYYFLLNSTYSLNKILKIKQQNISLPTKFIYVHLDKVDKNNVAEFINKNYVVEKHNNKNYNSGFDRYYIHSIDKNGICNSEEFRYTNKLSDNLYLMKISSNGWIPYFIDKNLHQTIINYHFDEFINNDTFIISKYEKGKFIYGLINSNNEIILKPQFNDYYLKLKEGFIDFIEFPILERNEKEDCIKPIEHLSTFYKRYDNTCDKDVKCFNFSINHNLIISTSKLQGRFNFDKSSFYYISDNNYKDEKFYKLIKEFKFDESYKKLNNVSKFLTIKEFQQLKENHNNPLYLELLIKQFNRDRVHLQNSKERLIQKEKEGCYIATMVYKNYQHPNVILLRNFRDQYLKPYTLGSLFIRKYYKYSPLYVEYVKNKKILNFTTTIVISIFVKIIKTWYNIGFHQWRGLR